MDSLVKAVAVGGAASIAVLSFSHRGRRAFGCGGRRHHRRHAHHRSAYLFGSEWQGLTEDEARAKLAPLVPDPGAIDEIIDELDTRGYLATEPSSP